MQSFGGKKNSYLELVMMPENNFKAKIVLDDESYIFEGKLEMDNSYSHLTSGIVEIKTKLLKRVFEFDTIEKRNYIVGNISIPLNEKKLSLN